MASDFTQLQQAIRLLNAHTRAADEQAWQVLFDRWLATLSSETRRQMQTVRFNHAQLTLLTTLDQSSRKQLRNQDLTAAVPFSQGLVSRYVARLVQLNLLTKLSLPDNRKAYIVALTPLGQQVAALHQQMHHHTNAQLASVLHTLDPQDVQTTIQVLTKLTAQPLHPKS
ncbi:MarR family transcriptional regulator [Lacticaseibacillus paracasei]|uniref:MarR family winged helix-turn-helix transcriptional regulator n=1 Tax=Lacticaseibacillus paracasei TaxID=1597 RepID=UPI00115882B5|nr:MarR family transcriptional regulator [Lacticaseibacillus paracasei]MCT3349582.1 MarR family transcriptional regulator [Lacticaseibacillus paracasei]VTZ84038.1 hypothetical protein LPCP272_02004 [Lacticaseibacillus paracasei]